MDLSRRLLSCDGCYVCLLNLLAWTDLSQQSHGSMMTVPFFYSDVTTLKCSAGIYISSNFARENVFVQVVSNPEELPVSLMSVFICHK